MALLPDPASLPNNNSPLSQKEIDIAVLQREKKKLEENERKIFRLKNFLLLGIMASLIGGVLGYSSVSSETGTYLPQLQLDDSLSTYKMYKDSTSNFVLDSSTRYTTAEYRRVQDSMTGIEQQIAARIARYNASELNKSYWRWIAIGVGSGFLVGVMYMLLIALLGKLTTTIRMQKINQELLAKGAQELKENMEKDFFTKLVEINFKYLDQYYLQTQEQADKSFIMCVFAAGVGFIVIIIGIVMMFRHSTNVTPAYITTAAGVLSEFIASIFFYLYNKTVLKMSQYHQKLVITQNISLALKTADALTTSKEKVLETIIERLTTDVNKYLTASPE